MVLFPLDQAREVLRFYRDFCPALPDEAEAYTALLTAPQGMPVIALLLGYNGPIADGEKCFAPARRFSNPSPTWSARCRTRHDRRYWTSRTRRTACNATGVLP